MRRMIWCFALVLIYVIPGYADNNRFTQNSDGTIKDNDTGIIWVRGEPSEKNFNDAASYCADLKTSGVAWRLPAMETLKNLYGTHQFPDGLKGKYWSNHVSGGSDTVEIYEVSSWGRSEWLKMHNYANTLCVSGEYKWEKEKQAWEDSGIDLESAKLWKRAGFNSPDALVWKQASFDPDSAQKWSAAGFSVTEASEWEKAKFTSALASEWKAAGYSLSDAKKWSGRSPSIIKEIGDICPNGIGSWMDLLNANPYDVKDRCFGIMGNSLQFLSRSTGLYAVYRDEIAFVDFGKDAAIKGYFHGYVKGLGAYEYIDVRGAKRTVPKLRIVKIKSDKTY